AVITVLFLTDVTKAVPSTKTTESREPLAAAWAIPLDRRWSVRWSTSIPRRCRRSSAWREKCGACVAVAPARVWANVGPDGAAGSAAPGRAASAARRACWAACAACVAGLRPGGSSAPLGIVALTALGDLVDLTEADPGDAVDRQGRSAARHLHRLHGAGRRLAAGGVEVGDAVADQ